MQNAVWRHEVGIATGAMNFFRALTSALAVAIMGAILLAGLGFAPERGGVGTEVLAANAGASGLDAAGVFQWVFVAALVFSVIALVARRPDGGAAAARREGDAAVGAGRVGTFPQVVARTAGGGG